MIGLGLDGYEPDSGHESAIAFRIRVVEAEQYIPAHSHRKGQLILALHTKGNGRFVATVRFIAIQPQSNHHIVRY